MTDTPSAAARVKASRRRRAARDAQNLRILVGVGAALGIAVILIVSIGSLSGTPSIVPDLVGMTPVEAEQALKNEHLLSAPPTFVDEASYFDVSEIPMTSRIWVVADQDVVAGTEVPSTTAVTPVVQTRLDAVLLDCGWISTFPGKSLSWDFGPTDTGWDVINFDNSMCIPSRLGAPEEALDRIEHGSTSLDEVSWENGLFTLMWTGGGGTTVSGRIIMDPEATADLTSAPTNVR